MWEKCYQLLLKNLHLENIYLHVGLAVAGLGRGVVDDTDGDLSRGNADGHDADHHQGDEQTGKLLHDWFLLSHFVHSGGLVDVIVYDPAENYIQILFAEHSNYFGTF